MSVPILKLNMYLPQLYEYIRDNDLSLYGINKSSLPTQWIHSEDPGCEYITIRTVKPGGNVFALIGFITLSTQTYQNTNPQEPNYSDIYTQKIEILKSTKISIIPVSMKQTSLGKLLPEFTVINQFGNQLKTSRILPGGFTIFSFNGTSTLTQILSISDSSITVSKDGSDGQICTLTEQGMNIQDLRYLDASVIDPDIAGESQLIQIKPYLNAYQMTSTQFPINAPFLIWDSVIFVRVNKGVYVRMGGWYE